MSIDETKMTLEFEIKSLDQTKKTIDTVPEVEKLSEDLQLKLANKYPGTTVKIARREEMPLHLIIQHILLYIDWHAVAAGAEKAAAALATTEFLLLMKSKLPNVFTKQKDTEGAAPADSGSDKSEPSRKSGHKASSQEKQKSSGEHK